MNAQDRIRVLVVGQVPPPYHGQAVMIANLLAGRYRRVELLHVPMAFSRTIDEVGRFRAGKLAHLLAVIARIWWARLRYRPAVLYFPPAGPNRIPVLRDIVLLLCVRPLFKRSVFHFHAGGVSELLPALPRWLRPAYRRAYFNAECAIQLSELNPPDGANLKARQTVVIPYGIADAAAQFGPLPKPSAAGAPPRILYVGALRPTKGTALLIDACGRLRERGLAFELHLVGEWISDDFRRATEQHIERANLAGQITIAGVRTGMDKWRCFAEADLFCFPSFYEAETFGLVVLEAMQFELPVVATRWRGIASLVVDGDTGYLVETEDALELVERLALLIADAGLRQRIGARGRERYLADYTVERWWARMEAALAPPIDAVSAPDDTSSSHPI